MYLDCATSAPAEVPWVLETFLASFSVSVKSSDPREKLGHLWIRPSAEDLSAGSLYRGIPPHAKKKKPLLLGCSGGVKTNTLFVEVNGLRSSLFAR